MELPNFWTILCFVICGCFDCGMTSSRVCSVLLVVVVRLVLSLFKDDLPKSQQYQPHQTTIPTSNITTVFFQNHPYKMLKIGSRLANTITAGVAFSLTMRFPSIFSSIKCASSGSAGVKTGHQTLHRSQLRKLHLLYLCISH